MHSWALLLEFANATNNQINEEVYPVLWTDFIQASVHSLRRYTYMTYKQVHTEALGSLFS